jgi:hypothetical protein
MLEDVPTDVLDAAATSGLLVRRLGLTDAKGNPLCGSHLEVLAHIRYDDNPRALFDLVLDKVRTHYPVTARRVNEDEFDLADSGLDVLQGGVTPTVRHGHIKLVNGATAVLLVTPTPPRQCVRPWRPPAVFLMPRRVTRFTRATLLANDIESATYP